MPPGLKADAQAFAACGQPLLEPLLEVRNVARDDVKGSFTTRRHDEMATGVRQRVAIDTGDAFRAPPQLPAVPVIISRGNFQPQPS
ncbi:hypothetical protein DQ384_04495 [Sphaerisporangium album]|uniref:Uncharacterized protein n=1 Tax=Sphaerisporangium album TaxID=509200 RepID=A0A367FSS2_9ACTN|nr:hypothetical protein DQ384_04495 [Sphaerisporangium album]